MTHDEITQMAQSLIESMGYACDGIHYYQEDATGSTVFNISTPDSRILIGRNGDVLQSVRYLVQKMAEQRTSGSETELMKFTIDINNYFAKRLEDMKTKAKIIANRVRSFKRDFPLEPMNPYERLIIHSILADEPDVKTESSGVGRERHIVVKFAESSIDESSTDATPTNKQPEIEFDAFTNPF